MHPALPLDPTLVAVYRLDPPIDLPLEAVGGAIERALVAGWRKWRMHHVERDGGWFKLERKRTLRSAIPCRLQLVSLGPGQTALEVKAPDVPTAERLVRELATLAANAPEPKTRG